MSQCSYYVVLLMVVSAKFTVAFSALFKLKKIQNQSSTFDVIPIAGKMFCDFKNLIELRILLLMTSLTKK